MSSAFYIWGLHVVMLAVGEMKKYLRPPCGGVSSGRNGKHCAFPTTKGWWVWIYGWKIDSNLTPNQVLAIKDWNNTWITWNMHMCSTQSPLKSYRICISSMNNFYSKRKSLRWTIITLFFGWKFLYFFYKYVIYQQVSSLNTICE